MSDIETADPIMNTPALDTANTSTHSVSQDHTQKPSTMELIQGLEGRVTAALRTLEEEDATFASQLTLVSDKIESLKRSMQQS